MANNRHNYTPCTTILLLLFLFPCLTTTQTSFESWRDFHNKTYSDETEETLRRQIYEDNLRFVTRVTGRLNEESLGVYGDITHEEFLTVVGSGNEGFHVEKEEEEEMGMWCKKWSPSSGASTPSSLDWRSKGAVTGVLKQSSSCPGNAYAIAALGAVTGQWHQLSGRKVAFSEQQVVDCSWKQGNMGCYYGSPARTYSFIKNNGGIATRVKYPVTGRAGRCRTNVQLGPTVQGCYTAHDEMTMKEMIGRLGPVTALLDISPRSLQFYRIGVFYDRTCHAPYASHHVLVTGYGAQYDPKFGRVVDYWLVKNSWGVEWGNRGYVKIARNMGNHCGIANKVTLPQVQK